MATNNVYSSAKIVNDDDKVQDFQLGTFIHGKQEAQNPSMQEVAKLSDAQVNSNNVDTVLNEIKTLATQVSALSNKVNSIETNGMSTKEIDAQVTQAIRDLKHYAAFFEQATFQMEAKLLKTSISIAQKIINIEIGENSANIAKQTISHLLDKVKTASRVQIHLNPKDYEILKDQLNLENFIELHQDANVAPGGVVIASDLGNFDGNIEAKVASMLETLDTVI